MDRRTTIKWMFAAAALLVLGLGLLFAARRRARIAART